MYAHMQATGMVNYDCNVDVTRRWIDEAISSEEQRLV